MFKRFAMGSLRTLLVELSKDPAMIIWLDNQQNHKGAINENFGRELLELFSMGVGNYTEDDVKECARAFTGWTIGNREYMELRSNRDSDWPYGRISWHFFSWASEKLDTPRYLTFPCCTSVSMASMVSSNGVPVSGKWQISTSM